MSFEYFQADRFNLNYKWDTSESTIFHYTFN